MVNLLVAFLSAITSGRGVNIMIAVESVIELYPATVVLLGEEDEKLASIERYRFCSSPCETKNFKL